MNSYFKSKSNMVGAAIASAKRKEKIDEVKRTRKVLCERCDYLVYIPVGKEHTTCKYCGRIIFLNDKAKFKHILNEKMKG